jgi:phosphatidate cytidylyltransferase
MSRFPGLGKRVATGVVGAALLILLVIYGEAIGVSFLTAIISLAMVYEYSDLIFRLPDKSEKRNIFLSITWILSLIHAFSWGAEHGLLILTFLGLFTYFLFTASRYVNSELSAHFQELAYMIFGLVYLVFLPFFLPVIRDSANGAHWTLVFLFIVWMGDTGAYFVGLRYGKRKLYPLISPKKTREGAWGGLGASFLITLLYKLILFHAMPWIAVLIVPVVVGVGSQIGDLCESFLKRAFDKKDSGTLLPGHGGVLDRFDGVIFSLPLMYACVRLFA